MKPNLVTILHDSFGVHNWIDSERLDMNEILFGIFMDMTGRQFVYLITLYVCKCEKMIQVQQAAEAPTYSPCFPGQGLVPVCHGSL